MVKKDANDSERHATLLAASDTDRTHHAEAVCFLGLRDEIRLFTNGQAFREYLVIVTSPLETTALNSLHATPSATSKSPVGTGTLTVFTLQFTLLDDDSLQSLAASFAKLAALAQK